MLFASCQLEFSAEFSALRPPILDPTHRSEKKWVIRNEKNNNTWTDVTVLQQQSVSVGAGK